MANFLTFEENQVIINNNLFPANGISLQLNANTVPVKDVYGNLLYYSPTGPIQGNIGINFFLTGALPSYLRLENQDETPVKIAFNRLLIPDCYLTNLSFSVKPFESIPVRADFVFYHGIKALNTDPLILNSMSTNIPANGIAYTNNLFGAGLNTLNGMASYILTSNRSTYVENPADFVVTDFDYQFSVERVPILRVGDVFPSRVAMKEANGEFSITTNNIDGYLDIHGNSAEFSAVLRDNTNLSVYDTIDLTGIIVDQSFEISDDNFGVSKIKMTQAINRLRSPITIPMEVSNPNIITPPTVNIVNPPNTPPTIEIKEEVKKEEPKPNDPEKGTTTTTTQQTDNDEYYWYIILVDFDFYSVGPNIKGNNYVTTASSFPSFKGRFTDRDNSNPETVYSYYFNVESTTLQGREVELSKKEDTNGFYYNKNDALILTFKVNKAFKNQFNLGKIFNDNSSNNFFEFTFTAPTGPENLPVRTVEKTYSEVWGEVNSPSIGDGTVEKPYIIDLGTKFWYGVGNN